MSFSLCCSSCCFARVRQPEAWQGLAASPADRVEAACLVTAAPGCSSMPCGAGTTSGKITTRALRERWRTTSPPTRAACRTSSGATTRRSTLTCPTVGGRVAHCWLNWWLFVCSWKTAPLLGAIGSPARLPPSLQRPIAIHSPLLAPPACQASSRTPTRPASCCMTREKGDGASP